MNDLTILSRSLLKYAGLGVLIALSMVVLYLAAALILTLVPVNSEAPVPQDGVTIFVLSNTVHTDILVPVVHPEIDWRTVIDPGDFASGSDRSEYIAFGWGDKGFYLDTPTWAQLKISTAIKAMLLLSPTAMHISYYRKKPATGDLVKKLVISDGQYRRLVHYLLASFQQDKQGNFRLISHPGYYNLNDRFYEANGYYTLFKTCNNWTNRALKDISVKTAVWAPFDKSVLYHLNE